MGAFLQGIAGGIQQAQENRLHRAQMEHLQAQTEHMKAQAKQVEGFHKLLKTMTEPKTTTTPEQPIPDVPGTGGTFPATQAELPSGNFDINELQGGPLTGFASQGMGETAIPIRENPGLQPTGQTIPEQTTVEPSQMDAVLANYSPQARSFISAALQSGDPNTISAIMARVMNPPQTTYNQFDPTKPIYAQTPGHEPTLFAPGEAKAATPIAIGPGHILVDPSTGKQIAAGPAKEETPKSPLTVSDENRVSHELYGKDYLAISQAEQTKVNNRLKKDKEDIALLSAQGKADVIKPPTPQEREKLTENESSLQSLSRLGNLYKPEFVGPVRGRAGQLRQAFGGTAGVEALSEEESRFRAEGAAFRNKLIKAITGSALSSNEQDRILKQIPSENDPPQTWEGKYEATVQNMEQHADLFKKVLKETKVDISTVPKTSHPTIKQPMAKPDAKAKERQDYLKEAEKKVRERMQGGASAAQP